MKKIIILILSLQLLLPTLGYAAASCRAPKANESFTRLCQNVDDIICKDVPDGLRRSCDERDRTIVHPGMSANEVYHFAKGCMQSAAKSFVEFFTEFLPDLCLAVWDLTKGTYQAITSPGFLTSIKGAYESARSMAVDVYEAVKKDPGLYFNEIWSKITEAISPLIARYDCMSPQAKVEKICGIAAEWVMPPAILAKVIVHGTKAAKELITVGALVKKGKPKGLHNIEVFESAPKISLKESHLLFKKYKDLGYSLEDFKLMHLRGKLQEIKPADLKSLDTLQGKEQYARLTGKNKPIEPVVSSIKKEVVSAKKSPTPSNELELFKTKYAKEITLVPGANSDFLKRIELDVANTEKHALYFDVENSVQKTLNDQVFLDKVAVDTINNSFFEKFNQNLRSNPELMSHLEGEYKDYKSYRIRLKLKDGEDPKKYEDLLAALYKKTNEDFANDPILKKVIRTIPPRTDAVIDPANWFLSGAGENALEANMSARTARNSLGNAPPRLTHFRAHVTSLSSEVHGIEKLRGTLAAKQQLLDKKILEKAADGIIIPSKAMIGILRKIKPSDFSTEEAFIASIRQKSKSLFGESLDETTARDLALYFKKVDALSPPMFSAERVAIDLKQAKKGIVSIDFAGIGVDNIYEQMKSLSKVDYTNASSEQLLRESFTKMQDGVNQVTHQMGEAKDSFSSAVGKIEKSKNKTTLFSGDDGIFMPSSHTWSANEKVAFVGELAQSADPSKYRVTFVATHFPSGKIIPTAERSKRIVRAESVEKEIRAKIIGIDKISNEDAKKFITAIDYAPEENGGVFNLIISGKKFSSEELKTIEDAFKSTIKKGESFGKVIVK